jgi:hypothetical protein
MIFQGFTQKRTKLADILQSEISYTRELFRLRNTVLFFKRNAGCQSEAFHHRSKMQDTR